MLERSTDHPETNANLSEASESGLSTGNGSLMQRSISAHTTIQAKPLDYTDSFVNRHIGPTDTELGQMLNLKVSFKTRRRKSGIRTVARAKRDCPRKSGFSLVYWHGLLQLHHATCHPTQHSGESRLVYPVHPLSTGNRSRASGSVA